MKLFTHLAQVPFSFITPSRQILEAGTPDGQRADQEQSRLEDGVRPPDFQRSVGKNAQDVASGAQKIEMSLAQDFQTKVPDAPPLSALEGLAKKAAAAKEAAAGYLKDKSMATTKVLDLVRGRGVSQEATPVKTPVVAEVKPERTEKPRSTEKSVEQRKSGPSYTVENQLDGSSKIILNDNRVRLTQIEGFRKVPDGQVVTITRRNGSKVEAVYSEAKKDYIANGKHAPIFSGDAVAKGGIEGGSDIAEVPGVAEIKGSLEKIGNKIFELSKEYETRVNSLPFVLSDVPEEHTKGLSAASEERTRAFADYYKEVAPLFAEIAALDEKLAKIPGAPIDLKLDVAGMKIPGRKGSLERNFRGMVVTPDASRDVARYTKNPDSMSAKLVTQLDSNAKTAVVSSMPESTPVPQVAVTPSPVAPVVEVPTPEPVAAPEIPVTVANSDVIPM